MKRFTMLLTAAAALGLAAYAPGVAGQTRAAQSVDPQHSMPTEDQSTLPPSSSGPSSGATDPSTMTMPQEGSSTSAGATLPSAQQSTRLAAIVPSGMSAEEACTGFKSVRECAAALHASQNLNIPFPDLKSRLTGGQRLGPAIHGLKPGVNAKEEARKAEEQARNDTHGGPQG